MKTVVAAVIQQDSRILICQRRRDKALPLKWEFPGGKVEEGESPESALLRELREELDVECEVGQELYRTTYQYPGRGRIELVFFMAQLASADAPDLNSAAIHAAFEQALWVAPQELLSYDFLEANAELIARLAERKSAVARAKSAT
jgi:8-oxo-dGTP diphosphatase